MKKGMWIGGAIVVCILLIIFARTFTGEKLWGSGGEAKSTPSTLTPLAAQSKLTLDGIQAAFTYSRVHNGASVLVYENGALVGEDYENGFKKGEKHVLASGTKSFNGVILAALIDDGFVSSFDQKVSDVITEWQHDPQYPAKKDVTLRELLSLSSGLQPGDENGARLSYQDALALPLLTSKRGTFQYGPAPAQVFGEFVKRIVSPHGYTDAAEYLKERILAPAGIAIAQWNGANQGEPTMAGGISMTADDWGKYGEFMRNNGTAQGTQIVRGDLLQELNKPSKNYAGYGIAWWLTTDTSNVGIRVPDPSAKIPGGGFAAAGAKNQRLYILPEYGIVVQRFGDGGDWDDREFLRILLGQ